MESQKRAHSMPQIPGQFLYPNMISISQEALDDKDQVTNSSLLLVFQCMVDALITVALRIHPGCPLLAAR